MTVALIILFIVGLVTIERERRARARIYDVHHTNRYRGDYIGPDWYAERNQP